MKILADDDIIRKHRSWSPKLKWDHSESENDVATDIPCMGHTSPNSFDYCRPHHHDQTHSDQDRAFGPFVLKSHTETNVSLLFIDMSGFTAAMEQFSAYGFAGLECFWRIINQFFGGLLCEVFNRGGDVECFCGDAMLISFSASSVVDNPICQAIRLAAVQKQQDAKEKGNSEQACIPNLSKLNWVVKLASMLAVDTAAFILRAMPYDSTDVRIGRNKVPLTIHLTVHGGIGTGTCMFNTFSFVQDSTFEKYGFFFPFGLALVDMTNAHNMSKSGEVVLSSNFMQQLFPSQHSDDCVQGWLENGWIKRMEDENFMLYSDGTSHAIPPPLLGGLISIRDSHLHNEWPGYSSIDAVLSKFDDILPQGRTAHEKSKIVLSTLTSIAKNLEMYVPGQYKAQLSNMSSRTPSLESLDSKEGSKRLKKLSTTRRKHSAFSSSSDMSDARNAQSSLLFPPNQASQMMVGELREATVGFVKFETTGLMNLNSENVKKEKKKGYLAMAWNHSTVQAPPAEELTELQNIISECVDAADAVISHGGLVNKFMMDDKGLSMLYAFGTPGCSFEGNSFKALWVALEIRMRIGDLQRNGFGIGLASGQVCVSTVGVPSVRCEYSLLGSTVNLASRLGDHSLKLGSRAVISDSMTIGLEKAGLADESKPEGITLKPGIKVYSVSRALKLKGKSETTRIYSIKREHMNVNVNWKALNIWMGRNLTPSDPIGRKSEFEALRAILLLNRKQLNGNGSNGCVIVEGEVGMGKSHLLKHLISLCGGADPDVLRARLQESDPTSSISPAVSTESRSFGHKRLSMFSETSASTAVSCNRIFFSEPRFRVLTDETFDEAQWVEDSSEYQTKGAFVQGAATARTSILSTSRKPEHSTVVQQYPIENDLRSDCGSSITTEVEDTNCIAVAYHCCSAAEKLQPVWPVVNLVTQLLAMCIAPNADGSFNKKDMTLLLSKHCAKVCNEKLGMGNLLDTLHLAGLQIVESDGSENSPMVISELGGNKSIGQLSSRFSLDSVKRVSWSDMPDDSMRGRLSAVHQRSESIHSMPSSQMRPSTSEQSNQATLDELANYSIMLMEAFACVVSAVRERQGPLVLIVDDAHMMDSSMMRLLRPLIRCEENVMFILATRGSQYVNPIDTFHYSDLRSMAIECFTLEPLKPIECAELTCHLLRVNGIDEALSELITQTCNGSPMFIEELCKDLTARGTVMTAVVHSSADVRSITERLKSMASRKNTYQIDGDKLRRSHAYTGMCRRRIESFDSVEGRESQYARSSCSQNMMPPSCNVAHDHKRTDSMVSERKISLELESTEGGDTNSITLSVLTSRYICEHEVESVHPFMDDYFDGGQQLDKGITYGFLAPLKKGYTVPPCISNAIVADVDRLKFSIDAMVVKVASVIGDIFSCEVLLAVVPKSMTELELLASLDRLCKHGLLKHTDDTSSQRQTKKESKSEHRFSFVNSIVWKACYDMMLQHIRRGIHIGVARVLHSTKVKDSTASHACLYHILQATLSSVPSNEEIAEIGPLVWVQALREGVAILVNILETKLQVLCFVGTANSYVMLCKDLLKSFEEWLGKISKDSKVEVEEWDECEMLVMEFKLMLIKCRLEIEITGRISMLSESLRHGFTLRSNPQLAESPKFSSEELVEFDLYEAYAKHCDSRGSARELVDEIHTSKLLEDALDDGDRTSKQYTLSLEKASLLAMDAILRGDMKRCHDCTEELVIWKGQEPLCLLAHDPVAMLLGVLVLTRGLICMDFKAFWTERQSLVKYCKAARYPSTIWRVLGRLIVPWFALGEAPSFVGTFMKLHKHLPLRDDVMEEFNFDMMTIFCELYKTVNEENFILKTYKADHDLKRVIDMYNVRSDNIADKLEQILELMRLKRNPMACCIAFEACILASNICAREEVLFIWEEVMYGDLSPLTISHSYPSLEGGETSNLFQLWFDICKMKHLIMGFEEEEDGDKAWEDTSSARDPPPIGRLPSAKPSHSEHMSASSNPLMLNRREMLNKAISALTSAIAVAQDSQHAIHVIQLTCLKVRARILLGQLKSAVNDFRPVKILIYSISLRYDKMCNICTVDDAVRLFNKLKYAKSVGKRKWDTSKIHRDMFSAYGELSFYEGIERGVFNQAYYGPPIWTRIFFKFLSTSVIGPIGNLVNIIMMTERSKAGKKGVRKESGATDDFDVYENDIFKTPWEYNSSLIGE